MAPITSTLHPVPVITVDGPTASGKGTIARLVAGHLGFHYLDSGALYRLTALSVTNKNTDTGNLDDIVKITHSLNCRFDNRKIFLDDEDVTDAIRAEEIGILASQIAAIPEVRQGLLALQIGFRAAPGLVADGRDMGTKVFPDAILKVFLTASVEERAQRRYKQLIEKGFPANIESLRRDLQERDQRDKQRDVNPLRPAQDAFLLDATHLNIAETVECVLNWYLAKK